MSIRSLAKALLAISPLLHATTAKCLPRDTDKTKSIRWDTCVHEFPANTTAECGWLTVPLDYTDPKNKATLDIEIVKFAATKTPSKGSIFFNFGGPGEDGRNLLVLNGPIFHGIIGNEYDLLTVVPRGTGDTIPFSCFESDQERNLYNMIYPKLAGNSSDAALGSIWATSEIFAETCHEAQKETGEYIGTAFAARDVMRAVDALGGDGLLRYWGISYGTVLGATIAAMFPDRIEKMVLDGVVNIHEYYSGFELENFSDADAAFKGFCEGCIANPEMCALFHNQTAAELEQEIYALLETLKYDPIAVPGASKVIDYSFVRVRFHPMLYNPSMWPAWSSFLHDIMVNNQTALETHVEGADAPNHDAEAQFGIKCSDSYGRAEDWEEVLPLLEERRAKSTFAGEVLDFVLMNCMHWQMDAKERYEGGFEDIQTKNPVLLVGNTYDPITPLASAKNLSASFVDSVVLQNDAYGHGILAMASSCTAKAVRSYFIDGEMPEEGTVCGVEDTLFSGGLPWNEVLEDLE